MKRNAILAAGALALSAALIGNEINKEAISPTQAARHPSSPNAISAKVNNKIIESVAYTSRVNAVKTPIVSLYSSDELKNLYYKMFTDWREPTLLKNQNIDKFCASLREILLTEGNIRALDFLKLIALHEVADPATFSAPEYGMTPHEQFLQETSKHKEEIAKWIEENAGISAIYRKYYQFLI